MKTVIFWSCLFFVLSCSGNDFTQNADGNYAKPKASQRPSGEGGDVRGSEEEELALASGTPAGASPHTNNNGHPHGGGQGGVQGLPNTGGQGPGAGRGGGVGARTRTVETETQDLFLGSFVDQDRDGDGVADRPLVVASSLSSLALEFSLAAPHQIAPRKTTRPVDIDFFILLDTSGSMEASISGAKENIRSFLTTLQRKNYTPRVSIIDFRDTIRRVFSLTASISSVVSELNRYSAGGGGDEVGLDAINRALDMIDVERRKPGGVERFYVIIVITDEKNWHSSRSTSTTQIENRLNRYNYQERIKFFASLNEKYPGRNNNPIPQYRALLSRSLTGVPVISERGDVDLDFPFSRRTLIDQLEPKIENMIPAIDLSCVVKSVGVSLSDGTTHNFPLSDVTFGTDSDGNAVVYVDDMLKGGDVQALKGTSADITVRRCCMEKTNPVTVYTSSNIPSDSECLSQHSKKIKFNIR